MSDTLLREISMDEAVYHLQSLKMPLIAHSSIRDRKKSVELPD